VNWLNIFKTYNLKKIRKEKLLVLFTILTILITTTLSIVVPLISAEMDNFNNQNIRCANGGDLFIKTSYESKTFNEEIEKLQNEGYTITYKKSSSSFFQNAAGKKFYANLISGEQALEKNEIILDSSMAKNLTAKVGDIIKVNTDMGYKEYTVKSIEAIPVGVTTDETIIGYGKISDNVTKGNYIYINGNTDGEAIKEGLKAKEDGYLYISLKDKEEALKNETKVQTATFGVLTTMGYILSSVAIITTSIMLITRRKRDISIMKLLSLRNKDIKNAMRIELLIIILAPVILSIPATIGLDTLILKMNFIPHSISLINVFNIIVKGILLNILFFEIFSNLPMLIIDDFKGIWLLRENEEKSTVLKKRFFIYFILLIPVMLLVYSIYIGSAFNFITSVVICVIITIFLVLSSILIKIFSSLHYKNQLLMYSFRNISKNFLTFILTIVSVSITVVFMMIAISLNNTVKESMNNSLDVALPYNYILSNKESLDIDSIFTKSNGVDGYIKVYASTGKVLNDSIKAKDINLTEVKKEECKLDFKIVEGENLFEGEDGCLITSQYQKQNNLKVGDVLNIYYKDENLDIRIKGIYYNSIINSKDILLPYGGYSTNSRFYVKSFNTKWMNSLGDTPVISIDILGSAFSMYLAKFLKIFKALSILVVFASLLFNINLFNITFIEERKEETLIRALGLGKSFISKVYIFKGGLLSIVSSTLAYSFYMLISKSLLKLFGINSINNYTDILWLLLFNLALTFIIFIYPFIKMKNYNSYELLREN
jgi:putative ABC transport system permease protein